MNNSLAHWTLLFWIPPVAAAALWTVFAIMPGQLSGHTWGPVWIAVIGASLLSPVVAVGVWLAHLKDWRRGVAVLVNIGGLAANGLGFVLAAGYYAG
ncbi:MAG TPA: hypothetical protein VHR66_22550 [Gemmataceae bacterium]|jgi:hypothetical protein|nr:hypothetical protein [Gemmataceae bacterium]